MDRFLAIILIPALLQLVSCSMAAPATQSMRIIPSEANAEIYVDGSLVGRGAQTVNLSKKSTHSVLAKCGPSAGAATIDRELSDTGVLAVIGGIFLLIPFFALLAPESYELMPNPISVAVPNGSACS